MFHFLGYRAENNLRQTLKKIVVKPFICQTYVIDFQTINQLYVCNTDREPGMCLDLNA